MIESGSWLAFELLMIALSVVLLGIALFVGLSNKRRPSLLVELFILVLVGINLIQILLATYLPDEYLLLIHRFGVIPARYFDEFTRWVTPGGWPALFWSPITYAFLHGNSLHVFFNGIALFIFGRTVAWRLGGWGFIWLFFSSSLAGIGLLTILNWHSTTPVVGASAGIFGVMGATFRFVPRVEDRLRALFWPDAELREVPLASNWEMITNRRSLLYILICLVIFPLGLFALLAGTSSDVAVMGHVGGFAFGVLAFDFFDRRKPALPATHPARAKPELGAESFGLRVLRALAITMMVVGMIMGLLGYYLQLFLS